VHYWAFLECRQASSNLYHPLNTSHMKLPIVTITTEILSTQVSRNQCHTYRLYTSANARPHTAPIVESEMSCDGSSNRELRMLIACLMCSIAVGRSFRPLSLVMAPSVQNKSTWNRAGSAMARGSQNFSAGLTLQYRPRGYMAAETTERSVRNSFSHSTLRETEKHNNENVHHSETLHMPIPTWNQHTQM